MRNEPRALFTLSILLLLQVVVASAQSPAALLVEPEYGFGKVVSDETVEHSYVVRNSGDAMLRVTSVTMTPPLHPVKVQATIAPHQEARLMFALDASKVSGPFDGHITLTTDDPKSPRLEMHFYGEVTPALEVTPKPAVVLVAQKGESKQGELELVNHGRAPIEISGIQYPKERVTVHPETIESGRRYKLHFALSPTAPPGRNEDIVVIRTTSERSPEVRLGLFTLVRERVYTFPEVIDLGQLSLKEIRENAGLLDKAAQTLMVYQLNGDRFSVKVRTDVAGLDLVSEPGPKGDRFQITAKLRPGDFEPGTIQGNIFLETNDREFPNLVVPVRGKILP